MDNKQIAQNNIKNFKANIRNLPENFAEFYKKNSNGLIANKVKQYSEGLFAKKNDLTSETPHEHDRVKHIKCAINALFLIAIYCKNKDKIHLSWFDTNDAIIKDSQKPHKKLMRGFMHFMEEATCALMCFALECIFLIPFAVLIEVEGDWKLKDLIEEAIHVYTERPKESWAILFLFIVLTVIAIRLSHHWRPKILLNDDERKDSLGCFNKLLTECNVSDAVNFELKDVCTVYKNCVISGEGVITAIDIENFITNNTLIDKPILDVYNMLDDALWGESCKNNLYINDIARINSKQIEQKT